MKVLVANLGSTSFKYRLFDMTDEKLIARGGVERIGSSAARCFVTAGGLTEELTMPAPDHGSALSLCLQQLIDPRFRCLQSAEELNAIGFKAVHAAGITGVHRVDAQVLAAMEAYNEVAPAHNPPYVKAMRLLSEQFPQIPLVAAFETGFHQTISDVQRTYAIPFEWTELGIKRWGFHGASHSFIAEHSLEVLKNPQAKVISLHLGGSSSVNASVAGKSVANSLGMSPQTGLPHNNRVGDFDVFALPLILKHTGKSLSEVLSDLANRSGLEGISGVGRDLRDIEMSADSGNMRAKLAIDVFVSSIRHYLGAYLCMLNGADAIVFTGGIGENSIRIRQAVCADLDWFGIYLDPELNQSAKGEQAIHRRDSRIQLWIMPTNEEIMVARHTVACLRRTA